MDVPSTHAEHPPDDPDDPDEPSGEASAPEEELDDDRSGDASAIGPDDDPSDDASAIGPDDDPSDEASPPEELPDDTPDDDVPEEAPDELEAIAPDEFCVVPSAPESPARNGFGVPRIELHPVPAVPTTPIARATTVHRDAMLRITKFLSTPGRPRWPPRSAPPASARPARARKS